MNEQNAIKDIRENICTGKSSSILCRDECMYGERRCAYQLAIKALEKQIPKKPIFVDVRFRHHGKSVSDGQSLCKCYKCPNCNTHIFHVFDDEKHCKRCGQKLDWTVEE